MFVRSFQYTCHFQYLRHHKTSLDVAEAKLGAEFLPQTLHLQLCLAELGLGLHEVVVDPPGPAGDGGLLGVGQVDVDDPSVHHGVVQPGHRVLSVLPPGHGHEAESLAAAVDIGDDLSVQHRAEVVEELNQVVLSEVKV